MAETFDSEENTTPETLTIENGTRYQEDEAAAPISVPLGGPIYDPNFVGPLTAVPDFETAVFRLLQQELEVELCLDSYSACEDISGTSSNNEFSTTPLEILKKMTALRLTNSRFKIKASNFNEHIAVQDPEVILCVEVFHCTQPWLKTQEFMVLEGQTLTELRDKIYCVMDQSMQEAGQHDASGYFMIEDVFFNDLRDPDAIDYSEPIFDWLKHSKEEAVKKWNCITAGDLQKKQKAVLGDVTSQLPQFRAFDMQKTRFCDLKFRLRANYLYCHQGDCKHTIVIRDMRLFHPEDVKNRAAYPLLRYQPKCRVRKCDACNIYLATRMTVDDKWAQENPCYFCETCYHCLHYDDDDNKSI